jgi:hypothetical protein
VPSRTTGAQVRVPAATGFEKALASRLIVRAGLTKAFGVNDYGIAVAILPAGSVSIPIGR